MGDLYAEAVVWGRQQAQEEAQGGPVDEGRVCYWTAWYAARQAAGALLVEAMRVKVSSEQLEALRKVAAEVAYD